MILVLDHYDSFTWNLVHLLAEDGAEVKVERADRVSVAEVLAANPRHLILSPGPGVPGDRGITLDIIRRAPEDLPILGVCLGHQAIGMAYGASLVPAAETVHGRTSRIEHDAVGIWSGVETPTTAMRYHSWILSEHDWPSDLLVQARTLDGERAIMGIRHRRLPRVGIQFHPESYRTPMGSHLVRNFLRECHS